MFKANNKDKKTTPMALLLALNIISHFNFIAEFLMLTLNM